MSGTGIFRKVLNPNYKLGDDFYTIEELSEKDKAFCDRLNAEAMTAEWKLDEADESNFQDLYDEIYFSNLFEFTHKGHEYDLGRAYDDEKSGAWRIYDRDLSNPKFAYNCVWETEPYFDYPDLPSLVFEFKLRNDGRTIAEYCCDYWKQPRILVPEPVDTSKWRKHDI